jgi:hypothetical protein
MWKLAVCGCAALVLGAPLRAGELDREQGSAPLPAVLAKGNDLTGQRAPAASELDRESPQQAWRWRHRWGCDPCFGGCTISFGACYYTPPVQCYSPVYYDSPGSYGGYSSAWGGPAGYGGYGYGYGGYGATSYGGYGYGGWGGGYYGGYSPGSWYGSCW